MLALYMTELQQKSFDEAGSLTGLHPDILRMLVRDEILEGVMPNWKDQVGTCDVEQAQEIANHLNAAREGVEGKGIGSRDAAAKYGFSHDTIYNWHKNGWISAIGRGKRNATLFNEGDIAFARALANLRGQIAGKAVFPARPRPGRPRKQS